MKLFIFILFMSLNAQAKITFYHPPTQADLDARNKCFSLAGEIQSKVNCDNLNLELRNDMLLFANGDTPINDPCGEASVHSNIEKLSNQQIYINSVKFSCKEKFNMIHLSPADQEMVKSYPNKRFLMWAGGTVFALTVLSILLYFLTLIFKLVRWIFKR